MLKTRPIPRQGVNLYVYVYVGPPNLCAHLPRCRKLSPLVRVLPGTLTLGSIRHGDSFRYGLLRRSKWPTQQRPFANGWFWPSHGCRRSIRCRGSFGPTHSVADSRHGLYVGHGG